MKYQRQQPHLRPAKSIFEKSPEERAELKRLKKMVDNDMFAKQVALKKYGKHI